MSFLPRKYEDLINLLKSKAVPWAANHAAIGTTSAAVTAMLAKATTAAAKLQAALDARESAKNATVDLDLAIAALRRAGADIVKQVRTKAATDGDGVYVLAEVPPPALPGPVPPPGTPTGFKVTLNPDGSVVTAWKCANPAGSGGTAYTIARKIGADGEFTQVGISGMRKWVDTTLPAGSGPVTYRIQAFRSTAIGPAAEFLVNFGVSGGVATAKVVSAPKLAA
ncbi:MAG TPA: hypothetical protein VEA69_18165 [Tepidisphaeraceae bacterium]|nr:hypothetical protein [Tepidisphaeraceae bacterium]